MMNGDSVEDYVTYHHGLSKEIKEKIAKRMELKYTKQIAQWDLEKLNNKSSWAASFTTRDYKGADKTVYWQTIFNKTNLDEVDEAIKKQYWEALFGKSKVDETTKKEYWEALFGKSKVDETTKKRVLRSFIW
ncbi:hypothetical protein MFERI15568_00383 [Mycoplasma feriruminatoris]|uniref:hypothetical protein n=1 Tax=Mycoplasma feriruminatoris TaxID=1179777 RepID=UPI00241F7E51|nr:hypothetical protein [Mycoplasma feriruminatoris]WFQ95951.1 hypothetical protein MFERI15568_00383 [Mycoplasma feriruminatoris]